MRHFRAPKGWAKIALEDLATVQTGVSKSASRSVEVPLKVPYLRVANVQDGYVDLTELKEIAIEKKQLARYEVRSGDVLLTEGGDFDKLGRGCVWSGQIKPCVHQNHVFVVRTENGKLSPYFLSSQAASSYGRAYFLACAKQTTNLASINSTQLRQFPVLLPSHEEQQRIVAVFQLWDRAIEEAERLLALNRQRKRALMQQLLTDQQRICGNPITPVGRSGISSSWEFPRARELFRSISIKNRAEESVLSVTQDQGVVRRDSLDRKIEADAKNHSSYKLVDPGDFVISLRSFQGGLEYSNLRGVVSPAYHVIRATRKIDHDYFRYLFKSYWFIGHLATAVIGIRDGKQISFDDFGFMRLPYPPLEEQRCIASVLKTCDEEIGLLREHVEALKQQKKGLMQQLLTGQVRVPLVTKDGTHDT